MANVWNAGVVLPGVHACVCAALAQPVAVGECNRAGCSWRTGRCPSRAATGGNRGVCHGLGEAKTSNARCAMPERGAMLCRAKSGLQFPLHFSVWLTCHSSRQWVHWRLFSVLRSCQVSSPSVLTHCLERDMVIGPLMHLQGDGHEI
jgi:hypothetical protein